MYDDELDDDPNPWQMTYKRRQKMDKATDEIRELIQRDPPPTFQEMQSAVDKLVFQFETIKNA